MSVIVPAGMWLPHDNNNYKPSIEQKKLHCPRNTEGDWTPTCACEREEKHSAKFRSMFLIKRKYCTAVWLTRIILKVWGWEDFQCFLKESSYAFWGCIYVKGAVKIVILWNITTIFKNCISVLENLNSQHLHSSFQSHDHRDGYKLHLQDLQ